MSPSQFLFLGGLFDRFDILRPVLSEHLEFYPDLLTHVLLADVVRWCVNEHRAGDPVSDLSRVIRFIEAAYIDGDPTVRELIGVSFFENLPRVGDDDDGIRSLIDPILAGELP